MSPAFQQQTQAALVHLMTFQKTWIGKTVNTKRIKKPKGRKLPVTGWKGPLKYRYLNDDGCLDGDDPWPVPKTTQHKGPLVKMVCGSLKVKFVDVVDDISARDAARMKAMLGREHIVSL